MRQVEESGGEPLELEVLRKEERITLSLTPVQTQDGSFKLGIWVRDNIQGIGTLTYVKADGSFGALGHGIAEYRYGRTVKYVPGGIYQVDLLSLNKGESGSPGELRGAITYADSRKLGEIQENREDGIYGQLEREQEMGLKLCEVGLKQEVTEGSVTILCDVEGQVEEYQAESLQLTGTGRIPIRDLQSGLQIPVCLSVTGGIVQGMSGSPIIQNGKLVGAVTHVFIRDSAQGYGIFIENMLEH